MTTGKTGWLIYRQADLTVNRVFANRLIAAAAAHGLQLRLVVHETLQFGVAPDGLYARVPGFPETPDFAIQRAVDPFLAMHLEAMGIRVFNRAAISAMCNDKAWTHQAVSRLAVPMLPTAFTDTPGMPALAPSLTWPAVIKAVGGRSGKQVHLAADREAYERLCGELPAGRYIVQPLGGVPGVDVRVFVIGGRIVAAIRREAAATGQGGFRANFSMGGQASVHLLTEMQRALVTRIAEAFPFDYVGIDFLLDEQQAFLFNEIEDAVGSRTLSICTDIDIADLFLAHVRACLEARPGA